METLGKILSIEEITNVSLENTGSLNGSNGSRLGIMQIISGLMGGACHASVGRVQVREDSLILRNTGIVLFRIVRKTREIKEREEK